MTSKKLNNVYVIAEAGVNHNGSYSLAKRLVNEACKAGADAIKFQIFNSNNLAVKNARKANYQKKLTDHKENQYEMLKKLELSRANFIHLKKYCREKNITFLSSIFDEESLDFLVNTLKVKKVKIPSGEITNGPLLYKTAKLGCEIILSTGMSNLDEIKQALSIITLGYLSKNKKDHKINLNMAYKAFNTSKGKKILNKKLTLLHCTTEYPTPIKDINLNAMLTLSEEFNLRVGYSDHSEGFFVSIIALAMGAEVIEKHFTIDKNLPGPDHQASLNPIELKKMIKTINETSLIMGSASKKITKSELKNLYIARKVIVAKESIKKGSKFSSKNITSKRAGKGISPMKFWKLLGKKSRKNYNKDQVIK